MKYSKKLHFTPRATAASALLMLTLSSHSHAQAFRYWEGGTQDLPGNGNGSSAGGAGVWDVSTRNWDAGSVPYVTWNNSANDYAAFGGSGSYQVTLGADVNVGRLAFNATGTVLIQSGTGPFGITLGGALVDVEFNSAKSGIITAPITGGSTNFRVGSTAGSTGGVLTLEGTVSGSGTTTIANGTLLKLAGDASLTSGNLTLNSGGILGLANGNFSRTVGSGVGQVQWGTSIGAGFAAFGATRTVSLGSGAINWTDLVGAGRSLNLSHETADATLLWQKAVSLSGGTRTVNVADGSANVDAVLGAVFSGGSSGTANQLIKTGLGTLALTAQNTHWGNTNVNAGTLMIGNGSTAGGVSSNSANVIVADGATLAANRSNTLTQGSDALKGIVSGAGSFAQVGSGITILTLANTYQGFTTVSNGVLRINGTHTSGNLYSVAAGATLQGIGSTASAITASGTISPGASVESFASGTLTMLEGSTFEYEVDSSADPGFQADLLVISGGLNLTGSVNLTFADIASSPTAFSPGSTFSLMNYSGLWNGGLLSYGGTELADGDTFTAGLNDWQIDYNATQGGTNFTGDMLVGENFVNITAAVPEPSTLLLSASGILALFCRRNRHPAS